MKARLSFIYFAMFGFVGIHMPFWPVWLKSRGIDAMGIAALTALSFALKIVVTPWVSRRVDGGGSRRQVIRWLTLGLLLGVLLFPLTSGFVQIFALTTLAFACWSPVMALAESLTMSHAKARKLDYGRIRLWGSVAFMVVVSLSGRLLSGLGEPVLLWAIGAAAAVLCVAAWVLPADLPAAPHAPGARPQGASAAFWRSPWFVGFLLATTLIQGSHAAYYAFASIHWRQHGLGDGTIGLLWGMSLAAEIAFFAFGKPVVDRMGPVQVLLLGGLAAALRFTVIGMTANPAWIGLAQGLHALSFGASHFAAMRLIAERVDEGLSATGQGLYSAFNMGVGMGLFVLLSGPLYAQLGAGVFVVMAGFAMLGTAVMAWVRSQTLTRITAALAATPLAAVATGSCSAVPAASGR